MFLESHEALIKKEFVSELTINVAKNEPNFKSFKLPIIFVISSFKNSIGISVDSVILN